MARILLHTLVFAPDGVSTSVLLSELMQDLQSVGHDVVVLTTQPHYNRDLDAEQNQPLTRKWFGIWYESEHHGIRVIHTFMPRKGERVGGRLRDYLIFHALSLILGLGMIERQDVIIAPSPPLTIGVIGWLLALLKGAKFVYNVREVYPELMVQMGLIQETSTLYRLFKWIEMFVYRRSRVVVAISDMFRHYIISEGIPESKVVTIPDFVDADFLQPGPKDNPLARKLELVDKYVVLYAGNIGMTQSFDTIIPVAERLLDHRQIHFLIVGDGARRTYVEQQIKARNLTNVTMLSYQPRNVVPDIYATADLGLVPLMKGTAKTTIPSKIYSILSSGRPVLVSVDLDSEVVRIVQNAECGIAVPPDNCDALEAGIRQAYSDREAFKSYGQNGRAFVEQFYSRRAVNKMYDDLIRRLVEGRE